MHITRGLGITVEPLITDTPSFWQKSIGYEGLSGWGVVTTVTNCDQPLIRVTLSTKASAQASTHPFAHHELTLDK